MIATGTGHQFARAKQKDSTQRHKAVKIAKDILNVCLMFYVQ